MGLCVKNRDQQKRAIGDVIDALVQDVKGLSFSPPVAYVYNPLHYAREAFDHYVARYGLGPKEVVLVGMNPGPWGMAQTGIPFGDVDMVKDWLDIEAPVGRPFKMHPKRLVYGYACNRGEVSGQRLWGWARRVFKEPERFFSRFFVANYCPLLFIEESGRNRTPDKLPAAERKPLMAFCDHALRQLVSIIRPRFVVGIGAFAASRAQKALNGLEVSIGRVSHPSPANPKANRGWDKLIGRELKALGIQC